MQPQEFQFHKYSLFSLTVGQNKLPLQKQHWHKLHVLLHNYIILLAFVPQEEQLLKNVQPPFSV